ncbi:MAG: hypothetical protein KA761_06510 [Gemmatimonadaceae bacterium]|nr:hypothetical protein [Gemmatimonadaceae bacterium]
MLVATVACDGAVGPGGPDPLRGLRQVSAADSSGTSVPQPFSPIGAGAVVGTVIGRSAPGAGNDSLASAPRIAGVTIRIYPIIGEEDPASPRLGAIVATVTTDANGRFVTPVVGSTSMGHVLTFTPPSGVPYAAMWTRTQFWSNSAATPWWVMLPRVP